MFDYLQQFNKLPQDLRERVSSPSAMAAISELENKYKVDLAATVMKVMVKMVAVKDLASHLSAELGLAPETATELAAEMKAKLFMAVADYLGLGGEQRALDLDKDIAVIIKDAGLVLPSAVLVSRFKNILATYLRGVRSKIDVRNSLSKDVKIGGLNLGPEEIDRVLKICAASKFSSLAIGASPISAAPTPSAPAPAPIAAPSRLDKIISASDGDGGYDLKRAIADGQVRPSQANPVPALDTEHEISAPAAQLDLPRPAEVQAPIQAPTLPPAPSRTIIPPAAKLSPLPPRPKADIPKPLAPNLAPAPVSAAPVTPPPPPIAPRPATSRPAPASPARPQMHDIRPMPKVMGPIEELQFLDIVNFRRLGATPAETTAKILAKIKLLEKDGYDKMVAGVKAWRQSPTNRLYLRLGQEAVAKGLPFREVLALRQKAGQESLSLEEVEAILSLNGKLVF